jgi:hypothetical protein
MLIKNLSFLIIPIITICSCRLPCNNNDDLTQVNKKPSLEFLAGNYKVDNLNKHGIKNTDNIKLTINLDSTIIFYNYPIEIIDQTVLKVTNKDTIVGTWLSNYYDEDETSSFIITYNKEYNLNYYPRSWSVYIKDNKPVLVVEFDDPDQCYYMRFIKL